MVETDYPHGDGTWPDTQAVIEKYWGDIPVDELRMMCSENAAEALPLPAARRRVPPLTPRRKDIRHAFTPTADKLIPDLSPSEELVLLARTLWREGYNDHLAGHITISLRRRDAVVQSVVVDLGRDPPVRRHSHRPRRQPCRGRLAGTTRDPTSSRTAPGPR